MPTDTKMLDQEFSKLEYLIDEGSRGNHILFTPEMIRICFSKAKDELSDLLSKNIEAVHHVLAETLEYNTFEEKRDYLQKLEPELQNAVIYGYFQLIEGALLADGATLH